MASPVLASTYLVRPDGTGDFPDIQAALDTVKTGDVVELANGIFTGDGNRDLDFQGQEITLCSVNGDPQSCIIDIQADQYDEHRGIYLHSFTGENTVVEGITFQNGYDSGMGSGVLIFQTHATLRNCVFLENQGAGYVGGAGVAVLNGSAVIEDCLFDHNHAYGPANLEGNGGGLYCEGSAVSVTGCDFIGNGASSTFDSGGVGGGIASISSQLTITGCAFQENFVGPSIMGIGRGAGFFLWNGSASLTNCLFLANLSAQGAGGAVATFEGVDLNLQNCTLVHNGAREGAVHVHGGSVRIANTIITSTYYSGYNKDGEHCYPVEVWEGEVILASCDVFSNDDGDWVDAIAGQEFERGNFSADPCFCDPAGGDFHLCADSWCTPENHPWGWNRLVGAFEVGCAACDCGGPVNLDEEIVPPDETASPPNLTCLLGAAPNPFNPRIQIRFSVAEAQEIKVGIWDLRGYLVALLTDRFYPAGLYELIWNGCDRNGREVPAGVYLTCLISLNREETEKIVLVR